MNNRTILLLLLLVLLGLLWFTQVSRISPATPSQTKPSSPITTSTSSPITAESLRSKIPAFSESLPELSDKFGREETLPQQIVNKKLPKFLADKEGSYTNLSDPLRGDGTGSIQVRSGWVTRYLFPNQTLPDLRVRVMKNPETGEYEPAGGVLHLPRSALEAGYEMEPGSDHHKATLQWKKSF